MLTVKVPECMDGLTVGEVLRRCGVSLTAIRRAKHLPQGITADGAPVYSNVPVHAGQQLRIDAPQHESSVLPQRLPLEIVFENGDAVVLEKPAGMAVHPTLNYPDGTLANAWLGELARRAAENGGARSTSANGFFPVYRLDKDTTGLLLCAQNGTVLPILSRSCRKLYAAILTGTLPSPQGSCHAPIGRAPGSVILRCVTPDGKPAHTRWQTVAQAVSGGRQYTLAAFILLTGRTHQIRVHSAFLGCPLAGDDLYGGEKSGAFPRQALHCAGVVFSGCDGGQHRFFSPFPQEMLEAAGISAQQANMRLRRIFEEQIP